VVALMLGNVYCMGLAPCYPCIEGYDYVSCPWFDISVSDALKFDSCR
jgi:hypothetical protein